MNDNGIKKLLKEAENVESSFLIDYLSVKWDYLYSEIQNSPRDILLEKASVACRAMETLSRYTYSRRYGREFDEIKSITARILSSPDDKYPRGRMSPDSFEIRLTGLLRVEQHIGMLLDGVSPEKSINWEYK